MEEILDNLSKVEGIIVEDVIDLVHQLHEGGKIAMKGKLPLNSISDIRKIYTPGVAAICRDIRKRPELAYKYTAIPNQVAIVTNGTARITSYNVCYTKLLRSKAPSSPSTTTRTM